MPTDTTFLNAQTVISNGQYTGNAWSNPQNLLLSDGQYASTPPTSTLGSDVVLGNFLFNIPANSLVSGIEIEITGYRGVSASPATALEIYAYDNSNGNNFFYLLTPVFTGFTTAPVTYYFGSSSFLFNTTWTADQINNLKLRLQANGQLFIDDVKVRVSYSPAGVPTPPLPPPFVCDVLLQSQPFKIIAPISANLSDNLWLVDRFQTSDGVDITNADIHNNGIPVTADQGKPQEENAYVVNIASVVGNQRLLTVVRGQPMRDGFGSGPVNQHSAGSELIIGNSIQMYSIFLRFCHIGTYVSAPIAWLDEGSQLTPYTRSINIVGGGAYSTGVSAIGGGQDITLFIPGFSTNPPQFITSINFYSTTQVTTFAASGLTSTGTDRFLLAEISVEHTQSVATAEWNGVPLVFQGFKIQGNARVEVWTLVAPALGIHTLDLTFSGPTYVAGNVLLFNAVDQTTPWTAGSTNGGNSVLSTGSATTVTQNAIVVHAVATRLVGVNYTAGGGESIVSKSVLGAVQGAVELQYVGSIATVTSDINISNATDWANLLGSINGVTPTFPALQAPIQFEDETGAPLGTPGTVDEFEITGTPVSAVRIGNKIIYTITGTGSGGGGNYVVDQTPDNGTYGLLSGAVNGINTTFTVAQLAYVSGTLIVYLNGLAQLQGASDDFVETVPGSGTFDFNVAPQTGDIITVIYQTANTIAQPGIQWEDEGVPLGTPGTIDEVDITGGGATASRSGNKLTINIPGTTGGPGISEQNLGGIGMNYISSPSSSFLISMTAETDGSVIYVAFGENDNDNAIITRFERDVNTGFYRRTHLDVVSGGMNCSIAIVGAYIYVALTPTSSNLTVLRMDKADLANPVNMTESPAVTISGTGAMFTDGTDLFINLLQSIGTWTQYTISGTNLTAVGTITGGPVQAITALQVGSTVYIVDSSSVIHVTTYTTTFTTSASGNFNVGGMGDENPDSPTKGVIPIDSTIFFVGLTAKFRDVSSGGTPMETENLIIKPFTIPT